jgi:hypothetical protein
MARGRRPDKTTEILLWSGAGGRCQMCDKPLGEHLKARRRRGNYGLVAHIVASDPNGKRGCPVRSPKLAASLSNLMLLCYECHKTIDDEKTWSLYPESRLLAIKEAQEAWVAQSLSASRSAPTNILTYGAPIGRNEVGFSVDDCARAITAPKTLASGQPIRLEMQGRRHREDGPRFWLEEIEHLRAAFNEDVRGRLNRGTLEHVSVFALAPMPLLIELGVLLSDITPADVFQRHREPTQWAWACDGPRLELSVKRPEAACKATDVKLTIEISASISNSRVVDVGPVNAPIWSITAANPHNDIIRYPEDLTKVRGIVRNVLDEIRHIHGSSVQISVFPAMPVSCAIELGRVWQPKAHPPLNVYDQAGCHGFVLRHKINSIISE